MNVFCAPFFAFTGHACPMHCAHRTHAGRPARLTLLIANGIGEAVIPSRLRRRIERLTRAIAGHGWHRISLSSRGRPADRAVGIACDTELPLRPLVVRLQLGIVERPIGQRAPFGRTVGRGHPEVLLPESPRHALPHPRAAAENHGVQPVRQRIAFTTQHLRRAVGILDDSRVTRVRADLHVIESCPFSLKMIAAKLTVSLRQRPLDQQDVSPCLSEHRCNRASTRAGTDNDHVVVIGKRIRLDSSGSAASSAVTPSGIAEYPDHLPARRFMSAGVVPLIRDRDQCVHVTGTAPSARSDTKTAACSVRSQRGERSCRER